MQLSTVLDLLGVRGRATTKADAARNAALLPHDLSLASRVEPIPADIWGEDAQFPVSDWMIAVANEDTRSGYWLWVQAQHDLMD